MMFLKTVQKNRFGAPLCDWRQALSSSCSVDGFRERYLLPTGKRGGSVPCMAHHHSCGKCCRMNTAEFYGVTKAFCSNFEANDVVVDIAELVEYKINLKSFCDDLSAAFGFEPLKDLVDDSPCVKIGMCKVSQRKRIPVYLAFYPCADVLESGLRELLLTSDSEFVLLTFFPITSVTLISEIENKSASVLNLSETVTLNEDGGISVSEQREIIEEIREQTPAEPLRRFNLPPGVGWADLQFYFPDELSVTVTIGDRPTTLSFVDMNMRLPSSTKPRKQWEYLLKLRDGRGMYVEKMPSAAFRQQIKALNTMLMEYFGLTDAPIYRVYDEQCYRTKFRIVDESENSTFHHTLRP